MTTTSDVHIAYLCVKLLSAAETAFLQHKYTRLFVTKDRYQIVHIKRQTKSVQKTKITSTDIQELQ